MAIHITAVCDECTTSVRMPNPTRLPRGWSVELVSDLPRFRHLCPGCAAGEGD